MKSVRVNRFAEKKIKQGISLLDGADFQGLNLNNQLVDLVSEQGNFLGTAYLSKQNKGVGWVLGPSHLKLDTSFFEGLLA